jgi:acrylyl-CoA reductase (NADPH)
VRNPFAKEVEMDGQFRAVYAAKAGETPQAQLVDLDRAVLPPGEVLIQVLYSSLNYKDGLAVTGKGKIIRRFPMVCGIDLAGTVLESSAAEFRPGDAVISNGQGLSETRWGGLSQLARLPAGALVPLPANLSMPRAMAIGTAGFTAMLCLQGLERMGVRPSPNPVVVTGAAGGVGSLAVLLLARAGYKVAASTGRTSAHEYLRGLGAAEIVDRAELAQSGPPLASERWAAGVDTVGGEILANLLAATASYGAVAACGLAGSAELHTTVFPFILRNVSLLGICSAWTPKPERAAAWVRLGREVPLEKLDSVYRVEPMSKIHELSEEILAGGVRGRVVIDVNA